MSALEQAFFLKSNGQLATGNGGNYGECEMISEADLPKPVKPTRFAEWLPSHYQDQHHILSENYDHFIAAAALYDIQLPDNPAEIKLDGSRVVARNLDGKNDQKQAYWAEVVPTGTDGVLVPKFTFSSFKGGHKTGEFNARDILFQQYRTGIYAPKYDPAEHKARAAKLEAESKARAAEREALDNAGRTFVAQTARTVWEAATEAAQHDYLTRKGIAAHGARVAAQRLQGTVYDKVTSTTTKNIVCDAGDLIIPLYNAAGELVNIQRIKPDSSKLFLKGGQTKGCYYRIEGFTGGPALVAEGFATAATVHEATGADVVVAFSAGNLKAVTESIKEIGAVAADAGPAGLKAAEATGLPYLPPPNMPDGSDWNDYADQYGLESTAQALSTLQPMERSDAPALMNGWDLADDAKAATFLVDGLLEEDAHGILGGASMTYKSFFALRLAHSVCSGEPFMGCKVFKPGPVVYVCGEGQGAVTRRLRALKLYLGGTPKNPIHLIGGGVNLNDPESMAALGMRLAQAKPVLVIFDTFASLAGGIDENSNSDVGAALNMVRDTCRAAGASSLIVHHFGKDAEKGFRGASAFVNNVDFAFTAKKIGAKVAEVGCHKMKDGEHFQPIAFSGEVVPLGIYDQNGKEATSLVAVPVNPEDLPAKSESDDLTVMEQKALDCLTRVQEAQVDMLMQSDSYTGTPPPVSKDDWYNEMRGAGMKDGTYRVMPGRLRKKGYVEAIGGNLFLPL